MNEWQPIETAPKDGTWVLLTGGTCDEDEGDKKQRVVTGQHTNYLNGSTRTKWRWQFAWYDSGYDGQYEGPTHWMPIPETPVQKQ